MRPRRFITTVILTSALLPLTVSAALRYDISIEVIREDETEYFSERVTVDGDNARVDFLDREGNPDGSYMVSNDAGKTIAIHDGGKSICAEWDRAGFFQTRVWNEKTEGVILRHTNVVRLTNVKSGKVQEKTENLTVSAIRELQPGDIAAAIFEVPACEKVEQSEMEHQAERMLKKYIK